MSSALSSSDHLTIQPSILYFGTPVVLVTTIDAAGNPNISPMSSAWALDDRVILGLGDMGQCIANLRETGECVLNLPSAELWRRVERIAHTTGRNPVPPPKSEMGFVFEDDKFALGGFTAQLSEIVAPPRIAECPLQLEAKVLALHQASPEGPLSPVPDFTIVETRVVRVHAGREIVKPGTSHIDTTRWQPLFYVFRHYFGLGDERGRNFRAED